MTAVTQRALVVEDEADIRGLIVSQIKAEGLSVDQAENGAVAASLIQKNNYDLIVVDWMMPELSGLELIRITKNKVQAALTPILMVTAKDRAEDIVLGLETGADDYLVKPFDLAILLARIKALLRRRRSLLAGQAGAASAAADAAAAIVAPIPVRSQTIQIAGLSIDNERFEVRCNAQEVLLTPMEFRLLWSMCQQPGKVLTRNKLIEMAAGEGVNIIDRAVDTHLFAVRKKLGPCADLIETVRGVGYRVKSVE